MKHTYASISRSPPPNIHGYWMWVCMFFHHSLTYTRCDYSIKTMQKALKLAEKLRWICREKLNLNAKKWIILLKYRENDCLIASLHIYK